MGGCFPCFGSSHKEGNNGAATVKELSKKDSTKDGSVGQSHHVNRVSSGKSFHLLSQILLFFPRAVLACWFLISCGMLNSVFFVASFPSFL